MDELFQRIKFIKVMSYYVMYLYDVCCGNAARITHTNDSNAVTEQNELSVVIIIERAVVFPARVSPAVTMSSPTVLLNNLVQEEETTYVDSTSKTYLMAEVVLGINRLVLFERMKWHLILLCYAYSLFLCAAIFYTIFFFDSLSVYSVVVGIDSVQYITTIVINSFVWKRMKNYYQKLQEFDMMVGCRPKISASSIRNFIQLFIEVFVLALIIPYIMYMFDGDNIFYHTIYLLTRLLSIIDIHFYGHLLSLIVSRLRLINYYMKISLNDHKQVTSPKVAELTKKSVTRESQNCEIKKLMDLYCHIISAYDILIDAIKWQFVVMLTSSFISLLAFSYQASLMVIRGVRPFINVAAESTFSATRLFPLFAPCVFSDQIQEEVWRLREHVASRLYEDKLNKPGRSVARALLALTEARDLSFSLLQIFQIDISLPFKFMGLLLTYLIILLQFEKVINP